MQPLCIEALFVGDNGPQHGHLAVDLRVAQHDRATVLYVAQEQSAGTDMQPLRIEGLLFGNAGTIDAHWPATCALRRSIGPPNCDVLQKQPAGADMQPLCIETLFVGDAGTIHAHLAIDLRVAQLDRAAKPTLSTLSICRAYMQGSTDEGTLAIKITLKQRATKREQAI